MQEKEKKRNKIIILIRFLFFVALISLVAWNLFLIKEVETSKRERAELKLNIEKVEVLEKANRGFIKDTLRRKAIALCFWDLIKEHEDKYTRKEKEDCIQFIVMADEKYGNKGLDAPLILAWIEKESQGNPIAVSLTGAKGLTQWMDYEAWQILAAMGYPGYDMDLIFDPVVNLAGGLYHLERLLNFWEWKSIGDKSPVLFYALHTYKWGTERTEALFQKEEKGNGQDVRYVDWILNHKLIWAEKLKYWIEDGQKLTKELQTRKMTSDEF